MHSLDDIPLGHAEGLECVGEKVLLLDEYVLSELVDAVHEGGTPRWFGVTK